MAYSRAIACGADLGEARSTAGWDASRCPLYPYFVKKRLVVIPLVVALLVAGTVGAVAVTGNDELRETSARYVPADALAFATVSLEPSVGQTAKLWALSQRLPESSRPSQPETSSTDLIESALSDDLALDDVTPWLGNEAAAALLRPTDGGKTPTPIAYLQVRDETLARSTLTEQGVDAASYRFVGGYLLNVPEEFVTTGGTEALDSAQALIEAGGSGQTLAANERYVSQLATLHDEHLALAWVDVPALVDVTQVLDPQYDFGMNYFYGLPNYETLRGQIEQTGAIALQAYARTDSIVMRVTTENPVPATPTSDGSLMKRLPADTVAAAHVSHFDPSAPGGMIEQLTTVPPFFANFDDSTEMSVPLDQGVETAEAAFMAQLAVDDTAVTPTQNPAASEPYEISAETQRVVDFLDTLEGEAVAAVGASESGVFEEIPVVVAATSADPAASQATLMAMLGDLTASGELVGRPQEVAGTPFVALSSSVVEMAGANRVEWHVGVADGLVYLGNDLDYLSRTIIGEDPGMGATEGFAKGIGDIAAQPLLDALYVDFDGVFATAQSVAEAEGTPLGAEASAWLEAMNVGGIKTWTKTDHTIVEATVVFD